MPETQITDDLLTNYLSVASKAPARHEFLLPEEKEVTDRGVVSTFLDYINRGYAGSVGAITAAQEGYDPIEGWLKGIKGETHKSAYDVLVNMGAPKDSTLTHVGGFIADIFPGAVVDPLSYLTFGLNKVGMLGKAASGVGKVAGALPETNAVIDAARVVKDAVIPMRLVADPITVGLERYAVDYVEAAKRGAWSPLNIMGQSVVPRSVAAPVAKVRQTIGDILTGTVTTETAAGRTGKTAADEIGAIERAISAPYRTGYKYLGGKKKRYGDVFQAIAKIRGELGEEAGANLDKLSALLEGADSEVQALVTHMIEEPALTQALSEGRKMRIPVPRSMTDEDVRIFADEMLPFVKVNQDAKQAYNTTFKAGLWGVHDAIDEATPREYHQMSMSELKRLNMHAGLSDDGLETIEDDVAAIFENPILGDALVKKYVGPDAVFEGLRASHEPELNARTAVASMLRKEKRTGKRFGYDSEAALYPRGTPKRQRGSFGADATQNVNRIYKTAPYEVNETELSEDALVYLDGEWHRVTGKVDEGTRLVDGGERLIENFDSVHVRGVVTPDMEEYGPALDAFRQQEGVGAREGIEREIKKFDRKTVTKRLENEPIVLFSRPGIEGKVDDALAGQIKGVGGYSREWAKRKETVTRYVEGMMSYRGDLSNKEAVRKAIGAPRNSKTFDTIWESVNDTVWLRRPGDHTHYADKMVKWNLVKLSGDPVAEFKVKQGLYNEEIQKRAIELDVLSKDMVNEGGAVDMVKQARQVELLQEIDGLRDELRNVDRFGQATYFKKLMDEKKRPVLKQPTVMKEIDPNRWTPEQINRAQEIVNLSMPIRRDIFNLYTKRGVDPPDTATYMQHILQGQIKGKFDPTKQGINLAKHEEAVRNALHTSMAMQNPALSTSDILERVNIEMAQLKSEFGSRMGDGRFNPLIFKRKWPFTILQMRESGIGPVFEEGYGRLLGEQYRVASNWSYGFDGYKSLITDYAGKYAKRFASPQDAPRGWVKIDYHVPFLKEGQKSPFDGWYIPKELHEAMRGGINAASFFSSDDGFNALIQGMHTFRRWWSSWTLAPFPAFHARNAVSNFMLGYMGHLNPITPRGMRAYNAAFGLRGEKHMQAGLQDYARQFAATFDGAKDLTADSLKTLLKTQNIDGVVPRDLDWLMRGDQIIAEIKKDPGNKTGWVERLFNSDLASQRAVNDALAKGQSIPAEILNFFRPETSPVIGAGFKAGREIESYFRSALFLHRLDEISGHVTNWDKAVEDATYWVNKHLYDYSDLSRTEQQIKAFVPFYTWTSRNLPHMLQTLVTEPGRVTYLNRALQGAWSGFDREVEDTDLPKWMSEDMGVPIGKYTDPDGRTAYRIWLPTGWVPMTELNELATSFRDRDSFARFWMSRMTPLLKEPLEQAMNRDTFFYEEITKNGNYGNLLGVINGPAYWMHALQNIRLIAELDRLNPGGVFTWAGRKLGYWEGERPHKNEPPEADRWVRALTGFHIRSSQPETDLGKRMQKLQSEIRDEERLARNSMRQGYTSEKNAHVSRMIEKQEELRQLSERLSFGNQVRLGKMEAEKAPR